MTVCQQKYSIPVVKVWSHFLVVTWRKARGLRGHVSWQNLDGTLLMSRIQARAKLVGVHDGAKKSGDKGRWYGGGDSSPCCSGFVSEHISSSMFSFTLGRREVPVNSKPCVHWDNGRWEQSEHSMISYSTVAPCGGLFCFRYHFVPTTITHFIYPLCRLCH
jgi:hypothetical protein